MNEWNIQSRAHGCQECESGFSDKEIYHTILCDEKQGYQRIDVCRGCWDNQYSEGARDRKGFISHWKGVYETPPPAPPEPIRKEGAESLMRQLIGLGDPRYIPCIYILGAMLERKRLLKVKEQIVRDNQRICIYEQPRTGDIFTVIDPELHLDQLEAVQHDVAALLEHGLNPPTDPDAAQADPEATASAEDAVANDGESACGTDEASGETGPETDTATEDEPDADPNDEDPVPAH